MERTIPSNEPIRWRKTGGGALYLHRKIIKPGQVFTARPSEISKAFRDTVIPLEEIPAEAPPPPLEITKADYSVKPRGKSKSWFDVVDSKGKVVNEKALTKEIAEKLVQDLSK